MNLPPPPGGRGANKYGGAEKIVNCRQNKGKLKYDQYHTQISFFI